MFINNFVKKKQVSKKPDSDNLRSRLGNLTKIKYTEKQPTGEVETKEGLVVKVTDTSFGAIVLIQPISEDTRVKEIPLDSVIGII